MESSSIRLFFALFLTIWGLGIVVNRDNLRKVIEDTIAHPAIQLIFGLIPLIIGAFIVAVHNTWSFDLGIIVTILGWLMLIGGAFRVIFVNQYVDMMKKVKDDRLILVCGLVTLAIGVIIFAEILY